MYFTGLWCEGKRRKPQKDNTLGFSALLYCIFHCFGLASSRLHLCLLCVLRRSCLHILQRGLLRNSLDFLEFASVLLGGPLRISLDSLQFVSFLQRFPLEVSLEFMNFAQICQMGSFKTSLFFVELAFILKGAHPRISVCALKIVPILQGAPLELHWILLNLHLIARITAQDLVGFH